MIAQFHRRLSTFDCKQILSYNTKKDIKKHSFKYISYLTVQYSTYNTIHKNTQIDIFLQDIFIQTTVHTIFNMKVFVQ